VKHIRNRLTYANVMSSIAVFLLLGGATAFAATKIGTSQLKSGAVTTGKIKKEAVTTAKIKKDAVTGAKVKESTLGTVPSATDATNAGNANTVGGLRIVKFSLNGASPIGNTQILDLNGLQLFASCAGGDVTATSPLLQTMQAAKLRKAPSTTPSTSETRSPFRRQPIRTSWETAPTRAVT
jgi:hypothetical protein